MSAPGPAMPRGRVDRSAASAVVDPDRDVRALTAGWLVLGLVVVGTLLRFHGLDSGLWYDEIRTVVDSVRSPLGTIVTHFPGNNDHLFYSVLAHLSTAVFGEQNWSLRLPAAVFGVAAIPMLYVLGRAVASRLEGLAAAGLLAVSYHAVWYAQNARGYTLLLFAALLSTHALLSAYRRDSRPMYALYAVVTAVGAYTHLTMVLVSVSHAAVIGVALLVAKARGDTSRRWSSPVFGFGLAAALTLALYAPVMGDLQSFFVGRDSGGVSVATLGWALREAVDQLSVGLGAGVAVLAAALVGLVGCWSYLRRNPLALALFVLPGPVLVVAALLLERPIFPRFFFFMAGFALLIGVRGAVVCAGWTARVMRGWGPDAIVLQKTALVAVLACMAAASAWVLPYNYRVPKQDYQGALDYLEATAGANDPIVVAGGGAGYPYQHYYGRSWPRLSGADELAALTRRHAAVWVVYTFPAYIEATQPALADALEGDCTVVRSFPGTVSGGAIVVNRCGGR